MELLFLNVPRLWSVLAAELVHWELFLPILADRLYEISQRQNAVFLPDPRDLTWGRDQFLTSPAFYEDCSVRIHSRPEHAAGDEFAVMAGILAEGASSTVRAMRNEIAAAENGGDPAQSLFRVYTGWQMLASIIAAAYPAAVDLVGCPASTPAAHSVSSLAARSEQLWELGRLAYPPDFLERIGQMEPRIVFLNGSYPEQLPWAVMLACKIRSALPNATLVLWPVWQDIGTSMAHLRETVLRTPSLFRVFDGIPLYTDLLDLTLSDVVGHVEAGQRTLGGIANVAALDNGRIGFLEPSASLVGEYVEHLTIGPVFGPLCQAAAGTQEIRPVRIAKVIPVRQRCYWNRCQFCAIATPSRVRNDPHAEERAAQTTELLAELGRKGLDMVFVGHEVVPSAVLHRIVDALQGAGPQPNWAYEGKFANFYTQEFIESLAKAGCRGVIFGLETASDRINALMNKHADGMNIREIERIIDSLDRAGVAVQVNTICDLPFATDEEFHQDHEWLRKMFHSHRRFYFNVNAFQLIPGSRIAERPSDYGIQVQGLPETEFLFQALPHRRLDSAAAFAGDTAAAWKRVFGTATYKGCHFNALHEQYLEDSCLAFIDSARGRNLFKEIQAELACLATPGELRLAFAPGLECVESDVESVPYVWLARLDACGGWIRLQREWWTVLSAAAGSGRTLSAELAQTLPNATAEEASDFLAAACSLVADGFFEVT